MAFKLGGKVFVHANASVRLAPHDGPHAHEPFRILACKSLGVETGGKVIMLYGTDVVPVALATASAEPSFTIEIDVMQVGLDYLQWCGDGALLMAHTGVITMDRPGLAPVSFMLDDMQFEKAFGFKSDHGDAPKDSCSGKMRKFRVKQNGIITDPFSFGAAA